ncbi:phospholipase A2 hemilipin [Eupeodes corollae]|uniref:phospholipase A2 hemilipin n=1 Tax=Eupeodes corollae TaxID=290404 RepID=UPI0024933B53|nr:phospholipase A2 hemilipin [Eupeodes corollae]XP_055913002.1 phospholipase A2 hemilipin [Eupeodes corollae]XP_055913003.1 phospholipase A2 hemilipin [Eupeodes corollae]XP_055913004.1 phospholipase A2 hemilipin [Eupeodes corollae]XP_055913005.1 phospholipase A2 hemilipin [Eupeodes corollae]XP_055913006.1 phospholipase A2 hemilipin [Eupeodes corollae]
MLVLCSKRRTQFAICLLSAVLGFITTTLAKPFSLPQVSFPSFTSITQQIIDKRSMRQMKTYSGNRISNDSLIMIYYHDLTIAVVELGPQKLLLNCELIEIYTDNDGQTLLKNLSKLNRPLEINFQQMLKLMSQCEKVDKLLSRSRKGKDGQLSTTPQPKIAPPIFSGIIPGTKWCGTGDIAETYSDLGTESTMDRCCRAHDLCPVKIRAYQTRYDLTNESLYTKSHCTCDDKLFSCLKETNTTASQLMGSVYFNLVQVPCVSDGPEGYQFRAAKKGF